VNPTDVALFQSRIGKRSLGTALYISSTSLIVQISQRCPSFTALESQRVRKVISTQSGFIRAVPRKPYRWASVTHVPVAHVLARCTL
jgi:hypothetical protein